MYKKAGLMLALFLILATPVYAHLTGAFADFLTVVYDESTIEQLKEEMNATEQEIAELTPKVDQLEKNFEEHQQIAAERLQFYSDVGLDTWLALVRDGQEIVDVMGSQWIMEKRIQTYMEELNTLYLEFKQVEASKTSLEGHHELLQMIEKNVAARDVFLSENAGLELEQVANYLDIDWTSEIEYPLIAALEADNERVKNSIEKWTVKGASSVYDVYESHFNEGSDVRYFFRSDHVYVVYERKDGHVILLGQVLQNENGKSAKLVLESGFYNGFRLPEELVEELIPFTIPYNALKHLDRMTTPYIQQIDGGLRIQSK